MSIGVEDLAMEKAEAGAGAGARGGSGSEFTSSSRRSSRGGAGRLRERLWRLREEVEDGADLLEEVTFPETKLGCGQPATLAVLAWIEMDS